MALRPGDLNLADHDAMAANMPPYDYFAVLRAEAPVFWNPPPANQLPHLHTSGFWVLSKYDDVLSASKDFGRFSCWENGILWFDPNLTDFTPIEAQRAGMMGMDPPQHTQFRRLVQGDFTPKAVQAWEPLFRSTAREIVQDLVTRDGVEFVFETAAEMPMTMLCTMMGVPLDLRREYLRLATNSASIELPTFDRETEMRLYLLLDGLVRSHGGTDDGTLLGRYLDGEVDGRKLTPEEISSFFVTLSIAGQETTRNTITHFVRLMDAHPEQKALLLEDLEGRLPNAIEEVLRFSPPVMQFCRSLTTDVTIRGQEMKAGDKVMISYVSANRDEDVFDDPDRFDILRPNAKDHLAFGAGPHFCLGAAFARMQLKCLLGELYTAAPNLKVTADPTWMRSVWFNAVMSMPVDACPVAH